MFYVYEWFIKESGNVFYVGKGHKNRYKVRKHNKLFNYILENNKCESRIIKEFDNEKEAFEYEYERINELWKLGQCQANIYKGGFGGTINWWTPELREKYSKENVMKSKIQRQRMSINNPMKNKEVAKKVGEKHRKPFYINDILFNTIKSASKQYNVSESTICYWLKVGYNNKKELVYYVGTEKPIINFSTNNHITNAQKVKYNNKEYISVKELSKELNVNYTTLYNYYKNNKPYNNKYIEKI